MATSSSRDYGKTRNTLISTALRLVRGLSMGGTPTAAQYAECSDMLNILINSWQEEGYLSHYIVDECMKMTADTATITLDADTVDVQNVIFSKNGSDNTLSSLTRSEYKAITNKALEGEPTRYYVDFKLAAPVMYLYPVYGTSTSAVTGSDSNVYLCKKDHTSTTDTVPITGTDYADYWVRSLLVATGGAHADDTDYSSGCIWFDKIIRVQDFDGAADDPDFHPRSYKALLYGLAADLAPAYGLSLQEEGKLLNQAEKYKRQMFLSSSESGNLTISPRFS